MDTDGKYYIGVTHPGFKDPVRLALEMSLGFFGPVLAEPGWFDADPNSWDLARKIHAAWLALPKCPCCGDDDHDGIFPLVRSGWVLRKRTSMFTDENVCPRCRNWAEDKGAVA